MHCLGFAGGFLYTERMWMDGITVGVLAGVAGAAIRARRMAGEVGAGYGGSQRSD